MIIEGLLDKWYYFFQSQYMTVYFFFSRFVIWDFLHMTITSSGFNRIHTLLHSVVALCGTPVEVTLMKAARSALPDYLYR